MMITTTTPVSSNKDWFEFILDLELLDKHFKDYNPNNDSFGCSLIIQFLYHANMTEQVYNNQIAAATAAAAAQASNKDAQLPQIELKTKRIRILRILAVKTASLLKWNLLKLEKEIPVAVMSDLLHIFLRYTMNINEQKLHSQLEIEKLDNYSLFAMQLLHRWCIRIIVFSKFPKRPQTKTAIINVPGIVNPLQHMKDANENILRVLVNNVQESVDFLIKCLNCLDHDINIPTSECFTNLSAESGNYDLIWSKSNNYTLNMLKCFINYDLGLYFFQQQNYENALSHFSQTKEFKEKITDEEDIKTANVYLNELNSYLIASSSMFDIEPNVTDTNPNNDKHDLKNLIKLTKEPEKNLEDIVLILLKDNINCKLSVNYRLHLMNVYQELNNQTACDRINSCNLIRSIFESSYLLYNYFNLKNLVSFSELLNKQMDTVLTPRQKSCLSGYLNLNRSKLKIDEKTINCLSLKNTSVTKKCYNNKSFNQLYSITTKNTLSNILSVWKQVLQTSDSKQIFESLEKYTETSIVINDEYSSEQKVISMKNFWPKWKWDCYKFLILKHGLSDNINNEDIFSDIFKTSNKYETQTACIYLSKINDLIQVKKYDTALNMVKCFESNGIKNVRLINDLRLYLKISKYLHEVDFRRLKYQHKQKNKLRYDIEKHIIDCKDYLSSHKYTDMPLDLCTTLLAFLLTVGEYEYLSHLSSQEANVTHLKKQRIEPIRNSNSGIIDLSRNIARLCLELLKTERTIARKIAREIWDTLIEIFTDNKTNRSNNPDLGYSLQNSVYEISYNSSLFIPVSFNLNELHSSMFTRQLLRKFVLQIKTPLVLGLFISLLSTLYNIGESMVNYEIFSEFRFLWPSSIANSNSLNLGSALDLMNTLLINYSNHIEPFDCYWLRTNADIYLASANYFDSFKLYLQLFVCDTNYFFKPCESMRKKEDELYFDDFIEKSIKSMIKSSIQMNKNTHAALLSQMIANNGDYLAVFKCLQDKTMLTLDEMDLVYTCLWDTTLLEFISYLNSIRGHFEKRNLCLKECSASCVNSANPNEVLERTVEAKKSLLFLKLIRYYITI